MEKKHAETKDEFGHTHIDRIRGQAKALKCAWPEKELTREQKIRLRSFNQSLSRHK